jgi:hypothetical protein
MCAFVGAIITNITLDIKELLECEVVELDCTGSEYGPVVFLCTR